MCLLLSSWSSVKCLLVSSLHSLIKLMIILVCWANLGNPNRENFYKTTRFLLGVGS